MKILILTGIFPPDIGGPATQLGYLIPDLMKEGFEASVITFGEDGRTSDLRAEVGGPKRCRVKKISKKIPRPFRQIFYILTALKKTFGVQTVYVWDLYTAGFSGFLIKKFFPKKRLILRFAGDSAWEEARGKGKISENIVDFLERKHGLSIELRKRLRKKIMTSADKVVVVSYFLGNIAEKIGVKKERIKMIYNSVDFLFQKKTEEHAGRLHPDFSDKNFNLITSSRLVPWKGQQLLIEIMPELISKYQNINLWIAGDGPEEKNLKSQIASLKLTENVFLLGKLSHNELFEYMKKADIFILNTDYEGLSHQILEAMHLGLPVVTTNVCSNAELIENEKSGFLVEYNNKKALQNSICAILDNPNLGKSFVEQAKAKLADFKWERLVKETALLLRSL